MTQDTDMVLTAKDIEDAMARIWNAPMREPLYVVHPGHKAHMNEHRQPVAGCQACAEAWASVVRL